MNIYKRIIRKILFIITKDVYKIAQLYKKDGVKMGENCRIYKGVQFGSEPYLVTLGNNVTITADNRFITHDGGLRVLRNMNLLDNADKFGRIQLGNNVWIGVRCIIMPGVTIGDNVIIGAGSIVTKDIPSYSVAAGTPCKVIKGLNDYYESIKEFVDYTNNMNKRDKKEYLTLKFNL